MASSTSALLITVRSWKVMIIIRTPETVKNARIITCSYNPLISVYLSPASRIAYKLVKCKMNINVPNVSTPTRSRIANASKTSLTCAN